MKETKEIKWQFADDYYKYLIKKLQRVDMALTYEEYDMAFKELRQIFAQINNPIFERELDTYKLLTSEIVIISNMINEYELLSIDDNKTRVKMWKITKLKYKIDDKIYSFYTKLMKVIDQLNMLFPKDVKKDWRGKEVLMPHG